MKHADASMIARNLVERLRPACERIEIAGSIRRGKSIVKDIEIVAMPDLTPLPAPRPMFGQPRPQWHKTKLDKLLFEMSLDGWMRPEKSGDKYKKFEIAAAHFTGTKFPEVINLDLFLVTPPARWGVQLAIRTGPALPENHFSMWIVTQRHLGGCLPNGYRVQDGAVWEGEEKTAELIPPNAVGFDEETDFLDFLGLGWIDPGERAAQWTR